MKLSLALLSAAIATVTARPAADIKADSKFGKKLLSKARKLEEDDADASWVPDMSVKFLGCHAISQWNPDAEGDDDVRIETKRLAIFRLCPTSSCRDNSATGCTAGYGDYIVDMDDFLGDYIENKQEVEEAECEDFVENTCDCEDGDDKDDGFDAEACLDTCYSNYNMQHCDQDKKYYDYYGNEVEQFDPYEYTACAQYEPPEEEEEEEADDAAEEEEEEEEEEAADDANNGRRRRRRRRNRRRLDEEAEGDDAEEEEVEYYIGAFCSNNGGKINLGMFTDDACTNFVQDNTYGRSTFYDFEGEHLPYSDESLVESGCVSCAQIDDGEQGDDDAQEAAAPNDFCYENYQVAGKCESNLDSDVNAYPNENACSFIEGAQTAGANGIINSGVSRGNKVASAFITMFAFSFVMLGSYVYYLKTKLDRGRINLSD